MRKQKGINEAEPHKATLFHQGCSNHHKLRRKKSGNAWFESLPDKHRWKQMGKLTVKDRLESAGWCKVLQRTPQGQISSSQQSQREIKEQQYHRGCPHENWEWIKVKNKGCTRSAAKVINKTATALSATIQFHIYKEMSAWEVLLRYWMLLELCILSK